MPSNLQTDSGPGVGELVSGIVHDAQELLSQQLKLFKQEVREDFRKTRDGMGILVLSACVLLVGSTVLSLMLVHLIQWAAPAWHPWVSYAIVGGGLTALGALLAWRGYHKMSTIDPLHDQAAKGLEENLEWKTKPN